MQAGRLAGIRFSGFLSFSGRKPRDHRPSVYPSMQILKPSASFTETAFLLQKRGNVQFCALYVRNTHTETTGIRPPEVQRRRRKQDSKWQVGKVITFILQYLWPIIQIVEEVIKMCHSG